MEFPFAYAWSADDVQFYADGQRTAYPYLQELHESICDKRPE